MNAGIRMGSTALLVALLLALAGRGPSEPSHASPLQDWLWDEPTPLLDILSGRVDDQYVTVEGQITEVLNPSWNVWKLSDGTEFIGANFGDEVPASMIPQNVTVRMFGEVDNGELKVEGVHSPSTQLPAASSTVAQVLASGQEDDPVTLRGQIKDQIDASWNIWNFQDGTGTIGANFEDDIPQRYLPRDRELALFGTVDVNGGKEIDEDLILVAGGGQPAETATTPPTVAPTTPATDTPEPSETPETPEPSPTVPIGPTPTEPPDSAWLWGPPITTVAQVKSGAHDGELVVIDGFITGSGPVFKFTDLSGSLDVSFEPSVPSQAVYTNTRTRSYGQVEVAGDDRTVRIGGTQTLDITWNRPNTTAAEVIAAAEDGVDVALLGEVTESVDVITKRYNFRDASGEIQIDFPDAMPADWVPMDRPLLLYGRTDGAVAGWVEIKVGWLLVAREYLDAGETAVPTTPAPPSPTPSTPTRVPTEGTPGPTPEGGRVFLPVALTTGGSGPSPTSPPGPTATTPPIVPTEPPDVDWAWGPVVSVGDVATGRYDDVFIVLEGQITERVDEFWNLYAFNDGSHGITLNFPDEIPAEVIPMGVTVRVMGQPDQGEVDVEGLQSPGTNEPEPSTTVAQVETSGREDDDVSLRGTIMERTDDAWNVWRFEDDTGSIGANFEDSLPWDRIPRDRSVLLFGSIDDNGQKEIDEDYLFIGKR